MNEVSMRTLEAYISRNILWIRPAVATMLLSATSFILSCFGILNALPDWIIFVSIFIGAVATGSFAHTVDTLSARVVAFFPVLMFSAGLYQLLSELGFFSN